MYRVSDSVCSGPDAAAPEVRNTRLRQRWDCLSKEASDEVVSLIAHYRACSGEDGWLLSDCYYGVNTEVEVEVV